MFLFNNGSADVVIITDVNAAKYVRNAAEVLEKYLHEVSHVHFQVKQEEDVVEQAVIVGAHSNGVIEQRELKKLNNDGYMIKANGKTVQIAGNNDRGTLYGVYEFLKRVCGIRWVTDKDIRIPQMAQCEIGIFEHRFSPKMEYRDVALFELINAEAAQANGLNGEFTKLDNKYKITPFAHSVAQFAPPKQYFNGHPEYFPLINGVRERSYSQLCFSNEELVEVAVQWVLEQKRKNPKCEIFTISQNDGYNWCECEKCKALNDKHDTLGGAMFVFVNKVAREVKKYYKDIKIDTLAYLHTRKPPKDMAMEDNVIVRYCNIETSITNEYSTSDYINENNFDKSYNPITCKEELIKWCSIAKKVFVWEYPQNAAHYHLPIPNIHIFAKNVKTALECGAKGMFLNMAYTGPDSSYGAVKGYVFSNLLWDCEADADALVKEACDIYYKEVSEDIQDAIWFIEQSLQECPFSSGLFCPPDEVFYSTVFTRRLMEIYDRALMKCKSNDTREKVKKLMLGIYVINMCHNERDSAVFAQNMKMFLQTIKECHVENFREATGTAEEKLDFYINQLKTKNWYGFAWTAE